MILYVELLRISANLNKFSLFLIHSGVWATINAASEYFGPCIATSEAFLSLSKSNFIYCVCYCQIPLLHLGRVWQWFVEQEDPANSPQLLPDFPIAAIPKDMSCKVLFGPVNIEKM